MMGVFLVDKEQVFSYQDLLESINKSGSYCQEFQTGDLFSFLTNLITGLISNQPITLVDADFSEKELTGLGLNEVNVKKDTEKPHFESIEDLILRVKSSKSQITIFTSGTTGQPKRVTHLYSNLSRAVKEGDRFSDNIWGYAYNPTHMAGLQVFFQAFENGNPIINIFGLSRQQVLQQIERYSITHISATPTFYRLLMPFEKAYGSVRRISFGGEKSSDKLYQSMRAIFPNAKINNIYASTEAGTLFSSHGSDFKIPADIMDRIIVKDDELYVHSSLLGYSDGLDLHDDYYQTGDLIEWIDRGNGIFRFKSRRNELINVGGYKVNPQEVEDCIRSIPSIKDVHVYGKVNSVLGNILCADVVADGDTHLSEPEIRNEMRSSLQEYKIPRRIRFVDTLGMTRTGKMKRL